MARTRFVSKKRFPREGTRLPWVTQRTRTSGHGDQRGRAQHDEAARTVGARCPAQILSRTCAPLVDLDMDVIVNAANKQLEAGGGVCGAIFAAAGEQLYEACRMLGGCTTGNVKATPGFCLLARYIFHAVGPTPHEPPQLLASCYRKCLDLAASMAQRSIAFPCISTGIYGMDPELAADIALRTVCDWLHQGDNMTLMDSIMFVFFKRAEETPYINRWAQFVEAPPPVMIRRIATAPLPSQSNHPPYRSHAGVQVVDRGCLFGQRRLWR